ncbi:MAG: hypothetical protein U9Q69_04545 [Nanoarchaeota archaeon]|nr:hypothetical protein [Nanoarchaeota archaeon]
MKFLEKHLLKKRGWISHWPTKAVFIYSGGLDSTITMAKLINEKKIEIYPLFINRGQTNLKFEKKSVLFFEKYFLKRYKNLFHNITEIKINIPPKEIKDQLKFYTQKFGHPLRNTILQMIGAQYAISLSTPLKRITTVFCAQVPDDPFPHSTLKSLRATTFDICQGLGEWDWQITSPNIDPILSSEQWDKVLCGMILTFKELI